MAEFNDRDNRRWNVALTHGDAMRVKSDLGIDLYKLLDDKLHGLAKLFDDPQQLVSVVYCLIEKQAEKAKVSPEDFAGSIDGQVLEDLGEALLEALKDFFPNRAVRQALPKVIQKSKQLRDLTQKKAMAQIDKLLEMEPEAMMEKIRQDNPAA